MNKLGNRSVVSRCRSIVNWTNLPREATAIILSLLGAPMAAGANIVSESSSVRIQTTETPRAHIDHIVV